MTWRTKLLALLALALLAFTFWHSRQIFFVKYEKDYLESLYYHSQWNIPQSPRGISDGLLYQFVGYRLVEGENTFNINFEVPPLGKYLYGLSSWAWGNPYWASVGLYLLALLAFYYLSRELLTDSESVAFAMVLLLSTPMVATQMKETMLDLPLMTAILFHAWFFVRFLNRKRARDLIAAGVFLGLATGIKFGAYTPPILLLGLLFLGLIKNRLVNIFAYLSSVAGGYVLAYFSYFIHHPNPIPWLRLHRKQIEFYLSPESSVDYLNQWRGIFLNVYQGWWGDGATSLGDWSLILPLGVIALIAVFVWSLRTRNFTWTYLALLAASFLLVNTFISFWARYLIPVVPFMILALVKIFRQLKLVLLFLVLANLPFLYSSLAKTDYAGPPGAIARFVTYRAYADLYQSLPQAQKEAIDEKTFSLNLENFYEGLETRRVNLAINTITPTSTGMSVGATASYQTRWGELSHDLELEFVEEHNQMRLVWDYDYLWPGYTPESVFEIENVGHIALREVRDARGNRLAVRAPGKAVYVITRVLSIPVETNKLAEVTNLDAQEALLKVQSVIPDHYPRFVGFLDPTQGNAEAKAQEINSATFKEVEFLGNVSSPEVIRTILHSHPQLLYQQADVWLVTGQERVLLPLLRPEETVLVL
jgi:hypothetical protein